MKAILVMFDSLNRRFLEPYDTATGTRTPNFLDLARRAVTFDRCYAGSLPCMPARRELHTGRYNFLHAPWGYLEPFDDSVPQILARAGVHTHLVSDHYHYWENAGGNYHCHYQTWEAVRGQEGDPWIPKVGGLGTPTRNQRVLGAGVDLAAQDLVNRTLWAADETQRPLYRTFTQGLAFLENNYQADNWCLTIEAFDPHEPFDAPQRLKALYPDDYTGPLFDWDPYGPVCETPAEVAHLRACYQALLTYCDEQLGRVLRFMDEHDLWQDTLLIVCTDHGHFLSEHGFWAKNYMPVYEELAHTPLFIWDPRHPQAAGARRDALVQTIDIPATLLDFFHLPPPETMQGRPMAPVIAADRPIREAGLFGYFGQMTCLVSGDYVLMRAPHTPDNTPLYQYTWMLYDLNRVDPSGRFDYQAFPFTRGLPVPKIPARTGPINDLQRADLLFNVREDPRQEHPLDDQPLQQRLLRQLANLMRASDAPAEQFVRLGLEE